MSGGEAGGDLLGELWSWDGEAWTAAPGPLLPRASAALAVGPGGRAWLFGGITPHGLAADLSPADGPASAPAVPAPTPRFAAGLAWAGERALLLGGQTRAGRGDGLNDAWIHAGGRWTEVQRLEGWPAVRGSPALVATHDGRLLVIGGGDSRETWCLRLVDP